MTNRFPSRWAACAAAVTLAVALPGCSLFVMAGKMFFGDPLVMSPFHSATRIDLADGDQRVLVYCSTPEIIKSEIPSLDFDLAEEAGRQMKRKGVTVISSQVVAEYLEETGGIWGAPTELVDHFDADYVLHFDLTRFDYREENSPNMFRGRVNGMVYAHRAVRRKDGTRRAAPVFQREFTSVYPEHNPIAAETMTARIFRKKLVDRIGAQLAQVFVDHRTSELVY